MRLLINLFHYTLAMELRLKHYFSLALDHLSMVKYERDILQEKELERIKQQIQRDCTGFNCNNDLVDGRIFACMCDMIHKLIASNARSFNDVLVGLMRDNEEKAKTNTLFDCLLVAIRKVLAYCDENHDDNEIICSNKKLFKRTK